MVQETTKIWLKKTYWSEINNNKNDNNNSITFISNNNNSTPTFQSNNKELRINKINIIYDKQK